MVGSLLFEKNKSNKNKKESLNEKELMESPKILLIDMEEDCYQLFKQNGFNVSKGTLGKKYTTSTRTEEVLFTQYLPNLEEQDIIIIDASEPRSEILPDDRELEKETSAERFVWISPEGQNYFNPRPLVGFMYKDSFSKILKIGCIIITFNSREYHEKYSTFQKKNGSVVPYSLKEKTHTNFDFLPFYVNSKNNNRNEIFLEHGIFERTFRRYQDSLKSELTFNLSENDYILAKDRFGEPVSFVKFILNKDNSPSGFLYVLPLSSKRNKMLIELMREILPSIHSNIFPDIANFKWLNKEEYLLPSIKKLTDDKRSAEKELKNKIKEIEGNINSEKQKYGFLYGILLPDSFDDKLVKNLLTLFSKFGYKDLKCPDDDIEGNKQEYIQIKDNNPILIEVKGISGKPSESNCQQVLKYMIRRQKEENRQDIHGMFIVNHQRNIEPLEREDPFTQPQIDDSRNSHYSLLSTWTLFKAFLAFERGELTFEDIDYCMRKPGLIEFLPKNWEEIGEVERVFPQQSVIGVKIDKNKLKVEDYIGYIHNDKYIIKKIKSIKIEGNEVNEGYPNQDIGIKIDESVDNSFKKKVIYKVTSKKLSETVTEESISSNITQ